MGFKSKKLKKLTKEICMLLYQEISRIINKFKINYLINFFCITYTLISVRKCMTSRNYTSSNNFNIILKTQ